MQDEIIEKLRALKPALAEKYGLKRMRVFGSLVRDDFTDKSDIDLLVDFDDRPPSLFGLAAMQLFIQDETGRDVDLVFEKRIFPELKDSILKDAVDV